MRRLAGVIVVGLGLGFGLGLGAGCLPPRPTLAFTDTWPGAPGLGDYEHYVVMTDAWTRTARMRTGYQQTLEVSATFKSAQWRAAHVARTALVGRMSPGSTATIDATERQDAADHYEVALMVTTWDRRENDLDRGDKAVWHVVLVDDSGAEIAPLSVVRDRRPNDVISAEFPNFGDFATAYIVKFPKTVDVFRAEARVVKLRVWGTRGAVEVAWDRPQ